MKLYKVLFSGFMPVLAKDEEEALETAKSMILHGDLSDLIMEARKDEEDEEDLPKSQIGGKCKY